jgi:CheY-specific phosphatase CheX
MFLRVAGIRSKLGDVQPTHSRPSEDLLSAKLAVSGDLLLDYVLSVSPDVAVQIAQGLLDDANDPPEELVLDCLKEMCNIVCGNATHKFDRPGRTATIMVPEIGCCEYRDGDEVVWANLHLIAGTAEVRVRLDSAA